jgi:hypothetical protein
VFLDWSVVRAERTPLLFPSARHAPSVLPYARACAFVTRPSRYLCCRDHVSHLRPTLQIVRDCLLNPERFGAARPHRIASKANRKVGQAAHTHPNLRSRKHLSDERARIVFPWHRDDRSDNSVFVHADDDVPKDDGLCGNLLVSRPVLDHRCVNRGMLPLEFLDVQQCFSLLPLARLERRSAHPGRDPACS